jgi:hypothetical protein
MGSILAIEADPKRRQLLTTLIREHVEADLTIVESVSAAMAILARQGPDLIVAPTLLSPQDSEQLISHVKLHLAAHVQMLTVPALDMLVEAPGERKRWLGFFRRRQVHLGLQYDSAIVGAQIADWLERAQTLRAEHDAVLAMCVEATTEVGSTVRASQTDAGATAVAAGDEVLVALPDDRRRADRSPKGEVSWLSAVRLPWGLDVHLVNISRTGLLVESSSKVTPGVTLELLLSGPGLKRVVMAHFVRSEVARVDSLGVRYFAAAKFEQPFDLLDPRAEPAAHSTPAQALAGVLATVLAESGHPREPAQVRFARGLRALIRARDVLVRHAPVAPPDDCESIYFHVKGEGRSRVILQVIFERDRALTASEFGLLKAAASMTAAVIELERSAVETPTPAWTQLTEVA